MKLKIGSRKSDLARIQAYAVGETLSKLDAVDEVSYLFKSSLGDQNQSDPLWQMPEKGVFTQDLTKDLQNNEVDLVVHSWKDLPVEERKDTFIAGTLPRADQRDLLLMKKLELGSKVQVFTSSPRRSHNLASFLSWALPGSNKEVIFKDVRGNIQTRVRKLLESDEVHGLVVAKAALDRMLSATGDEYKDSWETLKSALQQCRFMVLPLKENPTAAAQGAIAIEVRRNHHALIDLIEKINCEDSLQCVLKERKTLSEYGGGCHQKIGASYLKREYGVIQSLRGLTEKAVELNKWRIVGREGAQKNSASEAFPLEMKEARLFDDKDVQIGPERLDSERALFVAKSRAFPRNWKPQEDQIIWTAGLRTWRKLAEQGVWVHGSAEGLGESENPRLESLCGPLRWVKLTHEGALEYTSGDALATYALVKKELPSQLAEKKYFFWTSYSSFKAAIEFYPELINATHSCGPGRTAELIEKHIKRRPKIYLSYKEWRSEFK